MVRKNSFSLFEILITLAAIIIFFTFTIPKLSFVNSFIVQNEVDKLFSVFSFLQQKAIASNTKQELIFNMNNNSYSYVSDKINLKNKSAILVTHKLPKVVKFGFFINSLGPPSRPTKKIKSAVTFKSLKSNKFKALFLNDGKISPGAVFFVDKDKRCMMALTCPISQVSCIRKYKYIHNKWVCLK